MPPFGSAYVGPPVSRLPSSDGLSGWIVISRHVEKIVESAMPPASMQSVRGIAKEGADTGGGRGGAAQAHGTYRVRDVTIQSESAARGRTREAPANRACSWTHPGRDCESRCWHRPQP